MPDIFGPDFEESVRKRYAAMQQKEGINSMAEEKVDYVTEVKASLAGKPILSDEEVEQLLKGPVPRPKPPIEQEMAYVDRLFDRVIAALHEANEWKAKAEKWERVAVWLAEDLTERTGRGPWQKWIESASDAVDAKKEKFEGYVAEAKAIREQMEAQ